MQRPYYLEIDNQRCVRELPHPEAEVVPGIAYGEVTDPFTPAYWLAQAWERGLDRKPATAARCDMATLRRQIVFCLLGGYGITFELNDAAFDACVDAGLLDDACEDDSAWEATLAKPLEVAGRVIRYRFPRVKSRYLAAAMTRLRTEHVPLGCSGRELRDYLLGFLGIGPKTASWIARDALDCDDVAILDVHVFRAGRICGLFQPHQRIDRDYGALEQRYLEFAQGLGVRAGALDQMIWVCMREYGPIAREAYLNLAATNPAE